MGEPDGPREAPLRAEARERLARELHDELTHRVSGISLQVMGHRDSDDVERLRRSLDTIAAVTGDVLAHLWLLDRVLRAHPFDADRSGLGVGTGLPHLAVCEPVAALVEREVHTLRGRGLEVAVEAPDPAQDVGPLARRTLEQAIELAVATITRHAALGASCRLDVTISPGAVSLQVTAPLPGWQAGELEATWVALQERVRLTEGTLWMGHQHHRGPGTWLLVLRLRDR